MAQSHICTGCGNDLAMLRAPRDPVYGLPLVVCPTCKRPSVRTRASVERLFRRVQRTRRSVLALLAQGIMLALFLLAVCAPYLRIEELVLRDWRMSWTDATRALMSATLADETREPDAQAMLAAPVGVLVAGCVMAGVWLRFGLGHWRLAFAHGAWIVVVFLTLTLPPLVGLAHNEVTGMYERIIGLKADERAGRLVVAVLSAFIALAGTPLGRMLDRAWAHQRTRLFAKRRRRTRDFRRPPE